jgi:superfamily II DNA or RNA helicase/DNA-directed RNA polymerase specialized sigma24 family protein
MNAIVSNLISFLERVSRGEDTVLAPRQVETVEKIKDFLVAGYTEGLVKKPTGIGKTVIFTKFLEAVLNGTDLRALVVGPTKLNLRQNQGKLGAFGGIDAGAYYSAERNLERQVTVTTYHSLRSLVRLQRINPLDYAIIILDEVHLALGQKTVGAIEAFEKSIKLGFTATPEYNEDRSVAELLPFTIDEMSVREGIESNMLSGLKVFVMTTGMSAEHLTRVGTEFEEAKLSRTINTTDRNRFVVQLYKDERFYGKRAVTYGVDRAHAQALRLGYEQENIPAAYIDGFTLEMEREDILAKFKEGVIKVICNVQVLEHSFDEPECEVCFNAAPTMSKVRAEQRGGRVLRRSRVKDSKMGYVVEILDEFGASANTPVLFSEIAGAAEILSPSNREEEKKKVEPKIKTPTTKTKKTKGVPKKVTPGEVITDPDVIMALANRNQRQRFTIMFEYAPKGWVYPRRLAAELGVKESQVRVVAEEHSADHTHWFKRYLTPMDILTSHYHPSLVDLVRRHFNPSLEGMVTAEGYADQVVIGAEQAKVMLEAADESATSKAIRYDDVVYFSPEDHGRVIRREQHRAHFEELLQIEEAEEEFWAEDDRSDEEREAEYWSAFDEITSKSKGVEADFTELALDPLLHGDETIEFDEDRTHVSFDEVPDGLLRLETALRQALETLPSRHRLVITYSYLQGLSYSEITQITGHGRTRVPQLIDEGLRLLRHRGRLMVLWKEGVIDLEQLNTPLTWTVGLKSDDTPQEMKELVTRLSVEYACSNFR